MTRKEIADRLKEKYHLIVGELSLSKIQERIRAKCPDKILVSGRTIKTGAKRTVHISIQKLTEKTGGSGLC